MEISPAPPTRAADGRRAPHEILAMLRRHRWLLLASTLAGLLVGLVAAARIVPTYQASALLLVDEEARGVTATEPLLVPRTEREIGTAIEVLRSRSLLKEVVDSLHLQLRVTEPEAVRRHEVFAAIRVPADARPGRFRLERRDDHRFALRDAATGAALGTYAVGETIPLGEARVVLAPRATRHDALELEVQTRAQASRQLLAALDVQQPSADVDVVRVTYRGSDPELVRDVPNVLAARFIAVRESVKKAEARSTARFLRRQLDTLAVQLAGAEEQLRAFRESQQVIDPQVEASTQVGQLAELQAQRGTLEAERAALAQLLAEVQADATDPEVSRSSQYRRLIAFPSLLRNNVASELLGSLARLENERATLLQRRTPDDPDVQVLSRRITELENQLRSIATTYLRGLANQVQALDASLARFRGEMSRMPAKEVQFARLSRQPRVLQEMYELLQTRLKEAEIAQAVDDASVRVVDLADLPSEPVGPHRGMLAGLASLCGLVLGLGLVIAREYADQSVRTRADVQAAIGIPVLGVLPQGADPALPARRRVLPLPRLRLAPATGDGKAGNRRLPAPPRGGHRAPVLLATLGGAPSATSDAHHRLHANVMFAQPEAKVLLFTSPLPGDGKTMTAVNFATSLAQSGLRVLLIDADLRRGTVHEVFGDSKGPGLSDLLSEEPVFQGVLRTLHVGRGRPLRYIPAGEAAIDPVHVLGSPEMRELLESAAQEYDRIVIDTPPLNLFPDAAVLSGLVDGVLVVARAGATPFDALVDTAEQLRHAHANVLGSVLNGVDFVRDAAYDRAYRWYSYAASYRAEAQTTEPRPPVALG